MSTTEGRILDLLALAVRQCEVYGESEAINFFHRQMTSDERIAFDLFLVRTKYELAYQPGTCEHRFRTRVVRMLRLKQSGHLSDYNAHAEFQKGL